MNKASISHPVGRVRLVGRVEGVSFLLLLGVAMPLKRLAGLPEAVTVVGWAHGGLFILLMLLVASAWGGGKLSTKDAALAVVAAVVPFGPFLIDRRLARDEESGPQAGEGVAADAAPSEPAE